MCTLAGDQEAVKMVASRVSQEILAPRAAELDLAEDAARNLLSKIGEAGVLGMSIPPEYGGSASDALSLVVALEELAKGSASVALSCLAHAVACRAIAKGGNDHLRERLLPQLAQGTKLAALAVHEAGCGAVSALIESEATRRGDSFMVSGSKVFVTNGAWADYIVTLVRTDPDKGPEGISFLIMESNAAGFARGSHHRRMGLNGTGSRELFFEGCRVPADHLLGKEGHGLKLLLDVVGEVAMLGMAAIALGLSKVALEAAIRHSKQRIIGKELLGTKGAIRDMIAEMSALVYAMQTSVYCAATCGGTVSPFQAKLLATENAVRVTDMALQIHGGHGFSSELPVERYYRDVRGLKLHFMTSEILRETIAKRVLEI